MSPLPGPVDPLELLSVARQAAAAGAAVLARRSLEAVPELHPVNKSAEGDWVTDFDRAAEVAVREVLLRARPHDAIYGEELEDVVPENPSGIRWAVDPLDGTTNFIRNIVYYATSVAAVNDDGVWLAGVVHAPALVRVYSAARGHGAELAEHGNVRRLSGPDPQRRGKLLVPVFPMTPRCGPSSMRPCPIWPGSSLTCAGWGPRPWTCAWSRTVPWTPISNAASTNMTTQPVP